MSRLGRAVYYALALLANEPKPEAYGLGPDRQRQTEKLVAAARKPSTPSVGGGYPQKLLLSNGNAFCFTLLPCWDSTLGLLFNPSFHSPPCWSSPMLLKSTLMCPNPLDSLPRYAIQKIGV